jgi:hypothetical protein
MAGDNTGLLSPHHAEASWPPETLDKLNRIVTRSTSLTVVTPARTFAAPSSLNVFIPPARAASLISAALARF